MFTKIKRILFATDLSTNSENAFLYAASISQSQGAELVILHVVETVPASARILAESYMAGQNHDAKATEESLSKLRTDIKKICIDIASEYPECAQNIIAVDVAVGYPVDVILRKIKDYDCDALIMGTHGKGYISHALLGSVAERVLRRANLPVLVIPLPKI